MKHVLITGCAGFIGSNLMKRCMNEGWTVDGVDDLSNGHTKFMPDGASSMICDFADPGMLHIVNRRGYDTVFHIAAVPRVSYSVEHPLETNDSNVSKTLKLMDACRGNVGRFVFASSSSVYGGAKEMPTPETTKKDPKSPYALQKSIVEDYLRMYYDLYGLDSVCLRFFNVFGKNQLGDSSYATALSAWLTAIKMGRPMRSDGDGTQSRDMCHVDNVVDACVKASEAPGKTHSNRYNVACGDRTTNKDILDSLLKRYPNATSVAAPWRPGDVMHTQADVKMIKMDLGYEPLVRFWDGFDRTCRWYDDNWSWIREMKLKT